MNNTIGGPVLDRVMATGKGVIIDTSEVNERNNGISKVNFKITNENGVKKIELLQDKTSDSIELLLTNRMYLALKMTPQQSLTGYRKEILELIELTRNNNNETAA